MKKVILAIAIVLVVAFCGYEIYNINSTKEDNIENTIQNVNDSIVEPEDSITWFDAVLEENDSLTDENETVVENDTIVEIQSAE
jgi:hypothetical protein